MLEQLPFSSRDPALREARALGDRLKGDPRNLVLALAVARRYFDLGGAAGDPRFGGYAEAALQPWWTLENPPAPVRLLRAALRQRVHLFDASLADLDALVQDDPRNAQARLIRATVHQVKGEFDAAAEDCRALARLAQPLVSETCLANVDAVTGKLKDATERLQAAIDGRAGSRSQVREWALTGLAEMMVRAGRQADADRLFRQALELDRGDNYLLAAYADYLLDVGRAPEALELLRAKTRIDPLMLRYALALQATSSPDLADAVAQLRDRFEAARLRGDKVHLREEAMFQLRLVKAPAVAVRLALDNWRVQREPADLRILVESACAAANEDAIDVARRWIAETGFEDDRLNHNLSAPVKPCGLPARNG